MPRHPSAQTIHTTTNRPLTPGLSELGRSLQTPSGITLICCLLVLTVLTLTRSSGKAKLATSRWAKSSERGKARRQSLRQMQERPYNKVALSIGVPGDRHSQHLPDIQRGAAIIGAPGSGKTYSAINPLLVSSLLQGFSVIVYDFKYPKQTAELAPLAQHLGYDVHVFAPGFPESDVCNLLDFMQDANDAAMARQIAMVLYRNAQRTAHAAHTDDGFFADAGEQATVAALSLAKTTPYPDLAMAQAILRQPNLAERLKHAPDLPLWSRVNFDQLLSVADSEKTVASIIGTASGYFTRFMAPNLLGAFLGKSTLPLALKERQMVVIGMDKARRDAVGPLATTVLHMLITRTVHQRRKTPLIVALDELPTLYLPSLVQWINEYREQGLALLLGFQNLAQLEKTYDRSTARAIFGACATKILFNPGEIESAQLFSNYLGEEEVRYTEVARSHGNGKTTINRNPQRRTRKLFEAGQFLTLPTGSAVLINPGFGNNRQGSLPLRTKIQVPPTITRMIEASSNAWERLRPLLIQRSSLHPPDEADLEARMAYAKTILPLPPSSAEMP